MLSDIRVVSCSRLTLVTPLWHPYTCSWCRHVCIPAGYIPRVEWLITENLCVQLYQIIQNVSKMARPIYTSTSSVWVLRVCFCYSPSLPTTRYFCSQMFEVVFSLNAKLTSIEVPFCITTGISDFLWVLPSNFRTSPENAYMPYRSFMVVNLTNVYLLSDNSFTPHRSPLAIICPSKPLWGNTGKDTIPVGNLVGTLREREV